MHHKAQRIKTNFIFLFFIMFFLFNWIGIETAQGSYSNQTEMGVRQYFADSPEMITIAYCESGFRQYGLSGEALRGGWQNKMIGVFQIHEDYHRNAAANLGLNINTLEGNLAYAKHLYQTENTRPWISSANCWKNKVAETNDASLTKNELELKIEKLKRQVYILQIKLLEVKVNELKKRLSLVMDTAQ
jgi:hypothetical protein